jgi:hypothetical protein
VTGGSSAAIDAPGLVARLAHLSTLVDVPQARSSGGEHAAPLPPRLTFVVTAASTIGTSGIGGGSVLAIPQAVLETARAVFSQGSRQEIER